MKIRVRSIEIGFQNILFILLFLIPSQYLPLILLAFPFLGWSKLPYKRPSYCYLLLLPLAGLSQLFSGYDMNLVEMFRALEIVIFCMFAGKFYIKDGISPFAFLFIVAVLTTFAIGDMYQIAPILKYKVMIWNDEAVIKGFDYGGLSFWFRLGSIYYNPNILGQSLVYLMSFLFLTNHSKTILISLPLVGSLVFFTGSRTAIVIFGLQLLYFLYSRDDRLRRIKILVVPVLVGIVAYVIALSAINLDSLRILNLASILSKEESGGAKALSNLHYLRDLAEKAPLKATWLMMFGNGMIKLDAYHLDNELGIAFFFFGFVGLTMIGYRVVRLMIHSYQNGKGQVNLIWLASVGATTVFNFRFVLIVLVLYALVSNASRIEVCTSNPAA